MLPIFGGAVGPIGRGAGGLAVFAVQVGFARGARGRSPRGAGGQFLAFPRVGVLEGVE